ncbi:hypothetical protein CTAYLR_006780 [Chrysophaeum taylorii]|uniref:Endonuclease/exonuclease/phosphatase domain-containing protein n=1 Tax=Chrysophaeum taylorii TaxID=2483200 RepID=A0AAD7U8G8_9STRA|nr:hypothetical protein CTAYLR_006780 [Chrysophaeum taylorii]
MVGRWHPIVTLSRCAAISAMAAPTLSRLRVVSYNVHAFRDSGHLDNFERLVKVLKAVDADVICLNECLHPYAADRSFATARDRDEYFEAVREGRGRGRPAPLSSPSESYLERLVKALGMSHLVFGQAECDLCSFGEIPFGSAICSRVPVVSARTLAMRSTPEDAKLGGQPREVAESRGAVWVTLRLGAGHLVVATTHLDHKAEELRLKQMSTCLDALQPDAEIADLGALICGDFNTFQKIDHTDDDWIWIRELYSSNGWPAPDERSLVLDHLHDCGFHDAHALLRGDNTALPQLTCWTHRPVFRIDHCLVSDTLRRRCEVLGYRRLDTAASDHFPLVIDLEISPPAADDGDTSSTAE